jgi:hypothetical protein
MKKLSLILAALLFTTPAWATVRITVVPDGKTATIKYATDGEKVRAFALDITADKGVIEGISGFIRGESTKEKPGYGIFPANFARYITVDPDTGDVAKWDVNDYTPVADPCDPGALGGLGTPGITIEMGALYYPTDDSSPNAPLNQGTLFKLTLSEQAQVTVKLNEARGGVVLTNPDVPAMPRRCRWPPGEQQEGRLHPRRLWRPDGPHGGLDETVQPGRWDFPDLR